MHPDIWVIRKRQRQAIKCPFVNLLLQAVQKFSLTLQLRGRPISLQALPLVSRTIRVECSRQSSRDIEGESLELVR